MKANNKTKMKEVQASDLVPGKVYYIDSNTPYPTIHERIRQKGVFQKFMPSIDYGDYLDSVHFEGVENINKSHESGPGITGIQTYPYKHYRNHPEQYTLVYIPGRMLYYTKYTKFYECKKEEIMERKEKETLNMVLQQILGDSKFNFY